MGRVTAVQHLTLTQLNYIVGKCEYHEEEGSYIGELIGNYAWDANYGLPIIEREGISVVLISDSQGLAWQASKQSDGGGARPEDVISEAVWFQRGKTILEAGLRCYVESKLGNLIDIPERLIHG
jgi:hypothetical protein